MTDMFWDNIKENEKEKKEYEMHARSNENLRDKMDGVLEEGSNAQSCECSLDHNCNTGLYASGTCGYKKE